MTRNRYFTAFVLATALSLNGNAQSNPAATPADTKARDRITALSAVLRFDGTETPAVRAARLAAMPDATDKIRAAIDDYVQRSLTAREESQGLEARLRYVLSDHRPEPEFGDSPLAKLADLRNGRSLILAYTILRGPHHDIATIRGYRWSQDHFELVGTAGDDFAGYGMFKAELASPVAGEFWLLAWGQAQAFNGKKVRLRVFAFDGEMFRTMWSPDDMFNANVKVTDSGFSIEHEVEPQRTLVREDYRLTLNGPVRTK